jgi:hypothetical protein
MSGSATDDGMKKSDAAVEAWTACDQSPPAANADGMLYRCREHREAE